MNDNGLTRDRNIVDGNVFVAMPYGVKASNGNPLFNFDDFYRDVYAEMITELGLTPVGGAGRHPHVNTAPRPVRHQDTVSGPRVGERLDGEVIRVVPEEGRSGGYVLLRVPGRERPMILHCTRMSGELRADLNRGEIEIGELLYTEVVSVDPARDRIIVREAEEQPAAA
ncbi:hypothetical protein OG884_12275 [Streptosporangium sp. NBC_01755]|uniref:hypothetical protein n=1 Tax=Streptosporangium sp. NBC_01755 TaxID=2975949 RepID=UPI002DD7EE78|nr:hypothetical protein [Streptosporangium sp. NBC_01755]WSD02639.1 hypothetical protein OG884_12275 [Streptosporangium sp. NBC_01755]